MGARLDGWDEYFRYDIWQEAFQKCGVDPNFYTVRGYGEEELLPWDMIDVGVTKKFLLRERKRAYADHGHPGLPQGLRGLRGQLPAEGGGLRCLDFCLRRRALPSGCPIWI